jgi:hypothetical protein
MVIRLSSEQIESQTQHTFTIMKLPYLKKIKMIFKNGYQTLREFQFYGMSELESENVNYIYMYKHITLRMYISISSIDKYKSNSPNTY